MANKIVLSSAPRHQLSTQAKIQAAAESRQSSFVPSEQQIAVANWVKQGDGSAFVEAVAGSGKTSLLVYVAPLLHGSVVFAVFNKRNSIETQPKMAHLGNVNVATFHSLGFGAWRSFLGSGNCRVDATLKTKFMCEQNSVPFNLRGAVSRMVSIAKQSAVDVDGCWNHNDTSVWLDIIHHFDILVHVDRDKFRDRFSGSSDEQYMHEERVTIAHLIDLASECVVWSRQVGTDLIDFDDMIWLPLVEDVPIRQVDWFLGDEAQDTNVVRRLLARKMMKPNGNSRAIFVGDRFQSIYGFTGADSDAVDRIVQDFQCKMLPLTVSFRCSKAAVKMAQRWVPHIEAAEGNCEGSVERITLDELLGLVRRDADSSPLTVTMPHIFSGSGDEGDNGNTNNEHTLDESRCMRCGAPENESEDIDCVPVPAKPMVLPGDAILCRNTKPLVSLAFQLIKEGVGCTVEGRDIGKSLERLATRWKLTSASDLGKSLEAYRQRETAKLIARDAGYQIESLNDRVDTLLIIMDECETVDEVVAKISSMFTDSDGDNSNLVTLSTIHKAKGREWDRVFILGMDELMPSKYAVQPWELQQESNLMYVAVTRTKDKLVLVSLV